MKRVGQGKVSNIQYRQKKLKSSPSNGNKGQAVMKKEKKKCALGKKERLAAKLVVGKN